jgi:proteasome lid subunit RPN8/RPN11
VKALSRQAAEQLPLLRIGPGVVADITAHAVTEAPRECCGLLVGVERYVDENVRTHNLEPGVTRFLVDPAAQVALMKRLRGTGREILGAYHSHPQSEAVPSVSDIAETFSDDFLSIIVSLLDPDRPAVRAYRVRKGVVEELVMVPPNEALSHG